MVIHGQISLTLKQEKTTIRNGFNLENNLLWRRQGQIGSSSAAFCCPSYAHKSTWQDRGGQFFQSKVVETLSKPINYWIWLRLPKAVYDDLLPYSNFDFIWSCGFWRVAGFQRAADHHETTFFGSWSNPIGTATKRSIDWAVQWFRDPATKQSSN